MKYVIRKQQYGCAKYSYVVGMQTLQKWRNIKFSKLPKHDQQGFYSVEKYRVSIHCRHFVLGQTRQLLSTYFS